MERRRTPLEYHEYLDLVGGALEPLGPTAVTVALPAVIDNHRVAKAPNLAPSWRGRDVSHDIRLRVPTAGEVLVVQDTEAAAYAIQHASPSDKSSVLYMTLSTGVGGAWITRQGVHPLEVGHMMLNLSGERNVCSCGQVGCVEADLSGTAILRRTGEKAEGLDDQHPFWRSFGDELGYLLLQLTALFKLDQIVIGGGVAQRGSLFLEAAQSYVQERLRNLPLPEIKFLDDDAGVRGAYWLAARQATGASLAAK